MAFPNPLSSLPLPPLSLSSFLLIFPSLTLSQEAEIAVDLTAAGEWETLTCPSAASPVQLIPSLQGCHSLPLSLFL